VITEIGPVDCEVQRDRDGSFEPKTVKKRQRRLNGVDSMVISLTAEGLTTGEVEAHLMEVYSTEISRETISKITDRVLEEMADWQNRPLDRAWFPSVVANPDRKGFACRNMYGIGTPIATSGLTRELLTDPRRRAGSRLDRRGS